MLDGWAITITIALLAGNAFFVGAEFALIAARRTQIEPRAAEGSRAARLTLRAMENVSLMMAGAQLGITMCSLGLGAIGEPAVAYALEIPLGALGISGALLHTIAFTIALGVVVFLHMVLGEMVPKNIAIAGPERSALVLGPALYVVVTALKPLIVFLNWIANIVLRTINVERRDEVASAFTADEVAAFVAESRDQGVLDEDEHALLTGALTIGTETVGSVAVARDDLVTLPCDVTPAGAEAACVRNGYSRFPLTASDGEIVGYLHVKDILGLAADRIQSPIGSHLVRPLSSIPDDTTLEATLAAMQSRGTHVALVTVDGAVTGVAMLEDVVERLVGEVSDAAQIASR
ncbi:hemolysin family protein [Promicromonospora vindobonensis]|uniref:Hemolysin family protein n=1 Tax=Promicromonospora vindobonensis TaxID=195748 RepID=A0ABW5VX83_9MICO